MLVAVPMSNGHLQYVVIGWHIACYSNWTLALKSSYVKVDDSMS